MADMDFQLVLEAVVKGQEALNRLAKSEAQIAKSAKAANDASASGSGKAEAALKREAEAMQRAAAASKTLGAGAHAAAGASSQQAAAAERVASAERRAADATKAHASAATAEARAVHAASAAQAKQGKVYRGLAADVLAADAARRGAGIGKRAIARDAAVEAASWATPAGYLLGSSRGVAIGAGVGAVIAGGVATATAATHEAMSREVAFAEVQKKVNLEAGESWAQYDRAIARVSVSLGKSYQETAAIFDQFGSAGISGLKNMESYAMLAAQQSTAWGIGMRESASGIAETRAQMGKTLPEMQSFGDKVNFLGDISAAAERDIFSMSQRAIAAMKAAGVGEDASLALMTGLRSVGMQDEVAARYLGQLSSTLRRATSLKDSKQEAIKELGLTPRAVEAGMQTDALKTMVDLLDRLGKAKNPVKIANDLMGGEWFDETLRMKDALPEIVRLFEALRKGGYSGSMAKSMDIELSTTEAKVNQLKSAVSDLMAVMAKPIAKGWVEPAVEWATKKVNEQRAALEASEKSRAAVMPKGVSIEDYERIHGLDRPIPTAASKPMFAQIEGTQPHVAQTRAYGKPVLDVSQFGPAADLVTSKGASAYEALQNLNTTATPNVNVDAAIGALTTLEQKINAVESKLRSLGNFSAPSIGVPSAPSGGGVGKQSRLTTPGVGIVARNSVAPSHVAHAGTRIHYSPRIQVAGGADAAGIKRVLSENATHIASIVRDVEDRRGRLSFRENA